jgi:hypothetical protein
MANAAASRSISGSWIMAAASAVATVLSLYNDLASGTGIGHTYGALLVAISSVLILLASLALALVALAPRWLRGVLSVLLLLGILGTACAAYFLEAYVLLALMALALFGRLIGVMSGPDECRIHSRAVRSGVA